MQSEMRRRNILIFHVRYQKHDSGEGAQAPEENQEDQSYVPTIRPRG
jgi:hypothetical protein